MIDFCYILPFLSIFSETLLFSNNNKRGTPIFRFYFGSFYSFRLKFGRLFLHIVTNVCVSSTRCDSFQKSLEFFSLAQ